MNKISGLLQKRIIQLCTEQKMTYYALAVNSSVPLSTIMNIVEGNTQNPGVITVMKLCEGFGISVRDFFDTEEFLALRGEMDFLDE
uniref:helix-turn-helix domain-containing protein n=1 Tax=Agathobacter sp. TaxID=2021311 RepID=UPI0040569EA6